MAPAVRPRVAERLKEKGKIKHPLASRSGGLSKNNNKRSTWYVAAQFMSVCVECTTRVVLGSGANNVFGTFSAAARKAAVIVASAVGSLCRGELSPTLFRIWRALEL